MSVINLKIIYPDYYCEDSMLEVSDQIAKVLEQSIYDEKVFRRRCKRNGAVFFFDSSDEEYIAKISSAYLPLEEVVDRRLDREQLYLAMNLLSQKQSRRIYAHYILGLSKQEIAKRENVNESCIRESILLAEKNLRKILKNL